MSFRKLVLAVAALAMVVSLAACGSSGDSSGGDQKQDNKKSSESAKKDQKKEPTSSKKESTDAKKGKGKGPLAKAPSDTTLSLSIPKIDKTIDSIPTGRGDDTQLLQDNAAVHVLYTGYPWQRVANVYLAGHIEGYEGTPSYKAFDGIKQLENGDDLIVTDANGTKYTYKVYDKKIVHPSDVNVLNRVPGKNIVTLQTCELVNTDENGNPDYSDTDRLVVRGELEDVQS